MPTVLCIRDVLIEAARLGQRAGMSLEPVADNGAMTGDHDLVGWTFEIHEVSNGVWHGKGTDAAGRSVEASGSDDELVLAKLKEWAKELAAGETSGD